MKRFLILAVLVVPGMLFAQQLPNGFTCQDLIDSSEGKASRTTDGGWTYVPVRTPQPNDAAGAALLSRGTHLCYRLTRGEITVDQFNSLHAEKLQQARAERERAFVNRKTLETQQQVLRNQQSAVQAQNESVQLQRQTVRN